MAGEGRRWLPLIHRVQAFLQEAEALCLQTDQFEARVTTLGKQEADLTARVAALTEEHAAQTRVLAAAQQQQAREREAHLATMAGIRKDETEARTARAQTDDLVRRRLAELREENQALEREHDRLQTEIAKAKKALAEAYRQSLS